MTRRAVVLLSGGLDSAVAAYTAKEDIGKRGELYALSILYGQRHEKELGCARDIGETLEVENHIFQEIGLENLVCSSLTGDEDVPLEGVTDEIPSTWVPQRNSIFLALAFAYAETVGADYIYTGFNVVDYSGYPDCRPEFVERIEQGLNYASKRFITTGKGFAIITPLMHLGKAEIVKAGLELEVPFELTWSCYQGEEYACGLCDSCRIRLEAFKLNGMNDPILYK